MRFFKKLFKKEKAPNIYDVYSDLPEMAISQIAWPTLKPEVIKAGDFTLYQKITEFSQARPIRAGVICQGLDQEQTRLFGLIKKGKQERKWLIDRMGGDVLKNLRWEEVQSETKLFGLGWSFSCCIFDYVLEDRYQLSFLIYADEHQELWDAYDQANNRRVFCTIIKPQARSKLPTDLAARCFSKDTLLVGKVYPGLLDITAEGFTKTLGPFSGYRFKIPKFLYVISQAPSEHMSLSQFLSVRPMNLDEAISVLYQVARILSCLHKRGLVHGAIAPQHIFIAKQQKAQVYLNGFSLFSKEKDARSSLCYVFNEAAYITNSHYVIPECKKNSAPTFHSDQFLLGLTIHHLLRGKSPFANLKTSTIRQRLIRDGVPSLEKACPETPKWFSNIIAKMVEINPEKRYENMQAMLSDLSLGEQELDETQFEEVVATSATASKKPAKTTKKAPKKAKSNWSEEDFEDIEELSSDLVTISYIISPTGRPIHLKQEREFCIGRDENNDLTLTSDDVSRFHAKIIWKDNNYIIQDLDSANGVKVNGENIKAHILNHQDEISIGTNSFSYQEAEKGIAADKKSGRKKTVPLEVVKQKVLRELQTSLSGDISQISLWQVMQIMAAEEKSGCVIITIEGEETKVFFKDGIVIHCELGEATGHEVFYFIVTQQEGRFVLDEKLSPEEVTMNDGVESLLLEAARRLDEAT